MTEQELRMLVRDAIARHAAAARVLPGDREERRQGVPGDREERRQGVPGDREERRQGVPGDRAASGLPAPPFAVVRQHPSHGLLPVAAGADTDGPCVIEPSVQCNHCGYCKSYGH